MSNKQIITSAIVAAAAAGALAAGTGAPEAAAASLHQTQGRTIIVFDPAETKRIAELGIASVFDTPEVRGVASYSVDTQSRYDSWFVPSRNAYYGDDLATKMVREAASHPDGRVWVSVNQTGSKPLTLWTRW